MLRQHRLSLRQTFASIGTLVFYLIATKDAFISRIFLFNFVPWLYVALLFSHHYLPQFLARRIFTGAREEKTILVGTSAKAAQLARVGCGANRDIGLRTIGLISDESDPTKPTTAFRSSAVQRRSKMSSSSAASRR